MIVHFEIRTSITCLIEHSDNYAVCVNFRGAGPKAGSLKIIAYTPKQLVMNPKEPEGFIKMKYLPR
jgi:hypothetical protein